MERKGSTFLLIIPPTSPATTKVVKHAGGNPSPAQAK